MRIFDDPDHPQYGPVRRLWVVLAQLDLFDFAELYRDLVDETWDQSLASYVRLGYGEAMAQRIVLYSIMSSYRSKP